MQGDGPEDASARLVRSAEVTMETMVVEVTMSKDLFAMLGYSRSRAEEAIKEFSVLGLYLEQRISVGKAAELLGVRKREFVRLLARRGIPYFDYTDEDLDEEFRTVDGWKRETSST
jgi:predicted HTH domain antitoxin